MSDQQRDEAVFADLEPDDEHAAGVRGGEDKGTVTATPTTTATGKPNPGKMNWEHYFDKSSP
jgi:hypothetical protein